MAPAPAWQRRLFVLVLVATIAQLLVATLFPDLPQFQGKGFASRLIAYPLLMAVVPVAWAARARRVPSYEGRAPWGAFALIASPFLVDVTGNTLDLYDSVVWWDDANHFVNWFLLNAGLGLLLRRTGVRPAWVLGLLIAGVGALLAVAWELAEWYSFIRHGTELDTAYTDTLGDEVLGTLGGRTAAALLARRATTVAA